MTQQQAQPGWYPDQNGQPRWWDGQQWAPTKKPSKAIPITIAIVAGVVGLFMSMQSVSLLTGTGLVWTGAVIAVAGLVVACVFARRPWVLIVVFLLAAIAVSSAVYDEVQLQHKRHQLEQLTN